MQKLPLVKLFEKGKNLWEWVGRRVFATTCTLHYLAGVTQILATTKTGHGKFNPGQSFGQPFT